MNRATPSFKKLEELAWKVINFLYTTVLAAAVSFSPVQDPTKVSYSAAACNNHTRIGSIEEGTFPLILSALFVISALFFTLSYMYQKQYNYTNVAFPFVYSIFSCYFMIFIPLSGLFVDSRIWEAVIMAIIGATIVYLMRLIWRKILLRRVGTIR